MKISIYSQSCYRHLLSALLVIFLLSACQNSDVNKINYPIGSFPETVTSFISANSPFDDFNSGPTPLLQLEFPFHFSSNRSTQGGTFDIESMRVDVVFNQNTGKFSMEASSAPGSMVWPGTNTSSNEYGPAIVYLPDHRTLYFYASDVSGNLDIYHIVGSGSVKASSALNSMNDDAYPTFGPDSAIYFTSNRGGNFDIYRAEVPSDVDVPTWLEGSGNAVITKVDALSTAHNDKCPYINGKLLVFTSDRPGGYGGYDLYYSIYGTDGWSVPINFGPSINTAYDEYRPAAVYAPDYSNDLMIFSSNRPGGMGGFDLYYVGIQKMIK